MAIKKRMAEAPAPAKTKGGRDGYQVNLSDNERELIDDAAELAGLERSAFMRSESVKAARDLLRRAGGTT